MMQIEKPKILYEESNNSNFARFTVEPLEKGFGITIGNCMRRVLFSSLPGAAAIAVRINGVRHEFTTIPSVEEDVVEIILNLKNLAVSTTDRDPSFQAEIKLKSNKAGKLTAKDFTTNDQVEILNPDLHICTLAEGANLDMTVLIGRGRGYVPAPENKAKFDNIDYIAIDSLFSPIKKVSYSVEAARVGQKMDHDRLILEVHTNGTMQATEIISLAAKIVQEHLQLFINLCDNIEGLSGEILVNKHADVKTSSMEMPIEELDLTVRPFHCLKRANINTVQEITKKTKNEMLKVKNLGAKSLEEIIIKLNSIGLSLKSEDE